MREIEIKALKISHKTMKMLLSILVRVRRRFNSIQNLVERRIKIFIFDTLNDDIKIFKHFVRKIFRTIQFF